MNVKIIENPSITAKWERKIRKGVREGRYTDKQYLFFLMTLGTGLDIDEILRIKYEDLQLKSVHLKDKGRPKEFMYILLESRYKRKKHREILFPDKCKDLIREMRERYPDEVYLFQNNEFCQKNKPPIPWSGGYGRRFLAETAEASGISSERFGGHMLRRTFGYFQLKYVGWTLQDLREYFEMRTVGELKSYLGITDEKFD